MWNKAKYQLSLPVFLLLFIGILCSCQSEPDPTPLSSPPKYNVVNKSIAELQHDLSNGAVTSVALVERYIERIHTLDQAGPQYRSVLEINPEAKSIAQTLDQERSSKQIRGPLHGIPILLKDNIDTVDAMPTTAGSLALKGNFASKDSFVAKQLRAAGAIILGKTNLSEWANFRSTRSSSGWSAVGGQTLYPFDLTRNPCGSSSGSGVAVAMSFAAAAIGTETDGSITCPSSLHSLVGIKPTVGLISRAGIIPISESQDTAGPMTRTVEDAVLILNALAASDENDPATKPADIYRSNYRSSLRENAFHLTKIGVIRFDQPSHPELLRQFEKSLQLMRNAGAVLVDIENMDGLEDLSINEYQVLLTEFKSGVEQYLSKTSPDKVSVRTLDDLIKFNQDTAQETLYFDQEIFEQSLNTFSKESSEYKSARSKAKNAAGSDGIDKVLRKHRLDALVAITTGPSWKTDYINGDNYTGGFSTLAAVSGYPHITVPMGAIENLPVGISFIGSAWAEAPLLALAFSFEQISKARIVPSDPVMGRSSSPSLITDKKAQ